MNPDIQEQVRSSLTDLIAVLVGRVFHFSDLEQGLERVFGDDRGLERAIAFTSSFVALGNVLGHNPRTDISLWRDPDAQDYPLGRDKRWDADVAANRAKPSEPVPAKSGEPSGPEKMRLGQLKHSEVETLSPIRLQLWDEAVWSGNAFLFEPGEIPIFAPVFTDASKAAQIFAGWSSEFGAVDSADRLRVSVIRGIRRDKPSWYRVVFSSNPERGKPDADAKLTVLVARAHTMEPTSDINLRRFLDCYTKAGRYLLTYATRDPASDGVILGDAVIGKLHLHVREAWEIGPNDVDLMGIGPDDDPIIPEDQPNAPILELLRKKREWRPSH